MTGQILPSPELPPAPCSAEFISSESMTRLYPLWARARAGHTFPTRNTEKSAPDLPSLSSFERSMRCVKCLTGGTCRRVEVRMGSAGQDGPAIQREGQAKNKAGRLADLA